MPIQKISKQSFRWLIAELCVVVLGILLAFQVEEWRNERQERDLEIELLQSFILDLEQNAVAYQNYLDTLIGQTTALISLGIALESDKPREHDELKSLYITISRIWNWQPSSPTYDSWISLGRPDLISDEQLRIEMYSYSENWEKFIDRLSTGLRRELDLWENASIMDFYRIAVLGNDASTFSEEYRLIPSLDELPRDPTFIPIMSRLGGKTNRLVDVVTTSISRTNLLKLQIEDYLLSLQ